MSKIVTDFFGITTPDNEEEEKVQQKSDENNEDITNLEKQPTEAVVNEQEVNEEINEEEESDDNEDEDNQDEDDSEDESDEEDLQKLEGYQEKNVLVNYHPEVVQISEEELQTLSNVVKDKNGNIIDPFHKTIPILTKYEKAKIIGIRAQQINSGSEPFVAVDSNMIDGLTIAREELMQRKIPFIIRRPLPNGSSEYWNINDLELLE
jgi:DNA-directed RNA polymerase I, II, and III subunit RPABC2